MKNQDGQAGGRAEIDRLKEGTFCGGRKMRRAERKEREREEEEVQSRHNEEGRRDRVPYPEEHISIYQNSILMRDSRNL